MQKNAIAQWADLEPLKPAYALVADVDLVIVRWEQGEHVSVLYGRCAHRGAGDTHCLRGSLQGL